MVTYRAIQLIAKAIRSVKLLPNTKGKSLST